jgi:Zn-dependent protease
MALRFRVAGFPVQIHPLFFLTSLATGATGWRSPALLAVWFCVVLVSVLIHELGHALAFRRFGHGASIALHGLGGTTTSDGGRRLSHRQDLWVSLAGPAAGFLLGGLVLALQHFTPVGQAGGLVRSGVRALLWANFGWGLMNLLPILPLDGGHVLAALVRARAGNRFEWLIHLISLVTAACGLVLAVVWKDVWLGTFALALGVMNGGRFWQTWVERGYMLRIRAASKRVRPLSKGDEAAPGVERFLAELRLPSRSSPQERRAPPPQRQAPPERPPSREHELPDAPHDPQFVGELLLANGLAELAIHPLRTAFNEASASRSGHSLVTALLEAGRYPEVARLLALPDLTRLGDETLTLIATRAEAAGQPTLAARAREVLQGRASSGPLAARSAHDSEKSD